MTKLVAQSVINSFFDGKQADPFAVLGMQLKPTMVLRSALYYLMQIKWK